MTASMLAAYPDVFAGGAVIAGLPHRCATDMTSAFSCMNPGVNRTPRQWGDAVRSTYPGYTGPWPRVQVWHGTADYTVATANAAELRDQWTDVWGIAATPTRTGSLPGTSVEFYGDAVAVYRVSGMGHGTPVDPGSNADQCGTAAAYFLDTICSAYHIALAWGLGGAVPPPPPPPPPPPGGTCVNATNYAHVVAGRAYTSGGYTYARGSNQNMGLYNIFVRHALKETSPGYWVLADGEC